MTVALFAAGGVLAGLGTRACALAFIGAAVFGARQPQPLVAALCTWTAVMAAGWMLIDNRSPRAAAVPCLGAAAVLVAAGSPNGAVVLGLWLIGTVTAILSCGASVSGRRWALGLAVGDVVFAVAISTTAGRGFEGWPSTLNVPGSIALLAAAAGRAVLIAGPADADDASTGNAAPPFAATLIVRAQTVVLLGLAIAAAADRTTTAAVVVLGAVAFASASVCASRARVDAMQEVGLVAMAVGGAALGWIPAGWAWGALAAGTLIHHLRFSLTARPAASFADAIGRGGGVGLPFLPVCAALLEGAFAASTRMAIVVLLGVLIGFAGRARIVPVTSRTDGPQLDPPRAWGPVVVAFAACVGAPLLSLPRPPGGGAAPWPGLAAAAAIVLAAAFGSQLRGVVTQPVGRVSGGRRIDVVRRAMAERLDVVDVVATDVVLWATLTAVAAAAVVLWLIGLGRGFL